MGSRIELNALLKGYVANVYFQPPETFNMSYPCIVYSRSRIRSDHADNIPYKHAKEYTVIFIYEDPDNPVPDQLALLPTVRHERQYTVDNVYHDVFTLFF